MKKKRERSGSSSSREHFPRRIKMSGSLIRALVRFWADGKLTDWRPSDTETGSPGFPLQILSLPLLCSPPRPEASATLSLPGVCFSKNSPPSFRIHVYEAPPIHTGTCVYHDEVREGRGGRGVVKGRGSEGKPSPQPPAARASMPANLYWFLPSNTQSDIFLLRQSTRLPPTPPRPTERIVWH